MFLMAIDIGSILTQSLLSSVPSIIKVLWPFLVIALVIRIGPKLYQKYRFRKADMGEVDGMDGATFENFLSSLFLKMGYSVRHVGSPTGDFWADLII